VIGEILVLFFLERKSAGNILARLKAQYGIYRHTLAVLCIVLFLLSCPYFAKGFTHSLKCFEKSKRELGRALLACPFAGAAGFLGILGVY